MQFRIWSTRYNMAKVEEFYLNEATKNGRDDAHSGTHRTTVYEPLDATNLILMWFNEEAQRDMSKDEQTVYDNARADELNRIATK